MSTGFDFSTRMYFSQFYGSKNCQQNECCQWNMGGTVHNCGKLKTSSTFKNIIFNRKFWLNTIHFPHKFQSITHFSYTPSAVIIPYILHNLLNSRLIGSFNYAIDWPWPIFKSIISARATTGTRRTARRRRASRARASSSSS